MIEAEREAMRVEMKRLYNLWQTTGSLELDCYCKDKPGHDPDAPCHGDVLVSTLRWVHEFSMEAIRKKAEEAATAA